MDRRAPQEPRDEGVSDADNDLGHETEPTGDDSDIDRILTESGAVTHESVEEDEEEEYGQDSEGEEGEEGEYYRDSPPDTHPSASRPATPSNRKSQKELLLETLLETQRNREEEERKIRADEERKFRARELEHERVQKIAGMVETDPRTNKGRAVKRERSRPLRADTAISPEINQEVFKEESPLRRPHGGNLRSGYSMLT